MEFVEPLSENSVWEAAGLPFGSVSWLVPGSGGYQAFTRLFHPISGGPGASPRWRDLAEAGGLVWHPEIQFASLVSARGSHQARFANLGQERLAHVLRHVVGVAGEDVLCVAALCDIDGWASTVPGSPRADGTFGVSREALGRAGRLTGPAPLRRSYQCFEISASEVSGFGVNDSGVMFVQTQPTLVIATDGSFCLATDPDYDSTILAGSEALQNRVLRDASVESIAIDRTGSLLHDADHINVRRA
jgi:hypothetical protein